MRPRGVDLDRFAWPALAERFEEEIDALRQVSRSAITSSLRLSISHV